MWAAGVRLELSLGLLAAAERSEVFVRWLVIRAPHLQSLSIIARRSADASAPALNPIAAAVGAAGANGAIGGGEPAPVSQIEAICGANVAAALAVAGPHLRELSVEWDGQFILSGWAATLISLRIASFSAEELTVRPGLGSLPCLRDLRLKSVTAPLTLNGPSSLLLPSHLKALRMDGCHLRSLPPAVANLRHLTDLVLSNNALTQNDLEPLSRMTTLMQLTLMGTRMSHLPPALSSLTNLRVLYLDGVAGGGGVGGVHMGEAGGGLFALDTDRQICEALGPLRNLGILSLGSSRLGQFPSDLAEKSSLRVLYLDNNPSLATLPDGIYLRRLYVLGLDWRVLFASHAVLRGAPLLRKLCLTSLGGVEEVPAEERDEDAVTETLLTHPNLCQVLLPMVDGNRLPLFIPALNVTLRLAASQRIKVQAVTYGGISNEWIEFLVDLDSKENEQKEFEKMQGKAKAAKDVASDLVE
jgi:Leucine-rich repeat (LRR) protein